MPGVILLIEFICDHLAYQRAGPNSGIQPVSNRSTIENIPQPFSVILIQPPRTATAMAFPQSLFSVSVPLLNPNWDRTAMDFQITRDLSSRSPFQTHQNSLDSEQHSRLLIPLRLSAQFEKLLDRGLVAFGKCQAHIAQQF